MNSYEPLFVVDFKRKYALFTGALKKYSRIPKQSSIASALLPIPTYTAKSAGEMFSKHVNGALDFPSTLLRPLLSVLPSTSKVVIPLEMWFAPIYDFEQYLIKTLKVLTADDIFGVRLSDQLDAVNNVEDIYTIISNYSHISATIGEFKIAISPLDRDSQKRIEKLMIDLILANWNRDARYEALAIASDVLATGMPKTVTAWSTLPTIEQLEASDDARRVPMLDALSYLALTRGKHEFFERLLRVLIKHPEWRKQVYDNEVRFFGGVEAAAHATLAHFMFWDEHLRHHNIVRGIIFYNTLYDLRINLTTADHLRDAVITTAKRSLPSLLRTIRAIMPDRRRS